VRDKASPDCRAGGVVPQSLATRLASSTGRLAGRGESLHGLLGRRNNGKSKIPGVVFLRNSALSDSGSVVSSLLAARARLPPRAASEASPQTAQHDGGSLRFAGSLVGWPRETRGDDIFQGHRQSGGEPRRGLRQIPGRSRERRFIAAAAGGRPSRAGARTWTGSCRVRRTSTASLDFHGRGTRWKSRLPRFPLRSWSNATGPSLRPRVGREALRQASRGVSNIEYRTVESHDATVTRVS